MVRETVKVVKHWIFYYLLTTSNFEAFPGISGQVRTNQIILMAYTCIYYFFPVHSFRIQSQRSF